MRNNKYEIVVTTSNDRDIVNKCEEIASENNIKNGGKLVYQGLVSCANYVMYCTYKDEVVGYVALDENFAYKGDIYILQVAVKKEFQHQGVGTTMFNYLFHHSKQYRCITSNVRKDNECSLKLHKKFGFSLMDLDDKQFDLIAKPKRFFNKNLKITKKEEVNELVF